MITNIHERCLPLTPDELGALLETLASPDDQIWRSDLVEPIALSDGLAVGSAGGHGPVRYRVVEHSPGRRVSFEFAPGLGLVGHHTFEVIPDAAGSILRHTISARLTGQARLTWPILIRPIHDGALEDMLDHLERSVTGAAHRQARTPAWVRMLAPRLRRRRVRPTPAVVTGLLVDALDRIDAADCWSTPLLPGDSRDPQAWTRAVMGRRVPWVDALMRIRNRLARLCGLQATTPLPTGFPVLKSSADEVLLGLDDTHLSFRVGIKVTAARVSVTTTVQLNRRSGHLYWGVVRWFHPRVVRAMLRAAPLPS